MVIKTKKENADKKTIETVKIRGRIEYYAVNIISVLLLFSFGYIALMSFIQTSRIDPQNYSSEIILYEIDNIALNIFFTALFCIFIFKMKKHYDFFAKLNIKYFEIGLFAFVLLTGFVWIFSVNSIPAADSKNVYDAAVLASRGNYSFLNNDSQFYNHEYYNNHSYFNYFPYQLGFVFLSELAFRLFGVHESLTMQIINVLCIAFAYLGIAKITRRLFKKISVEFFAILLLAGCFQPVLFCTFVYGNLIGVCFTVWACYFLIKYFQDIKYIFLLPCAAFLILATLAKYNNLIVLAAFVIVLVLHTIKDKKWQSVAFALALCIAVFGANTAVVKSYELRSGITLESGVPQSAFLDMGLNESHMAPGWYSSVMKNTYINGGYDTSAANDLAKADISKRIGFMLSNPAYAIDFFSKKVLSQWNEPTFESIWISEVKGHGKPINGIAEGMYNKSLGQFFELYFNFYTQILYAAFAIGIYFLLLRRKMNIESILLPLILLGGFGYHLLFEAKSQYVLTYIIFLIPTASYGFYSILNADFTKIKELVQKLKTIPETENL